MLSHVGKELAEGFNKANSMHGIMMKLEPKNHPHRVFFLLIASFCLLANATAADVPKPSNQPLRITQVLANSTTYILVEGLFCQRDGYFGLFATSDACESGDYDQGIEMMVSADERLYSESLPDRQYITISGQFVASDAATDTPFQHGFFKATEPLITLRGRKVLVQSTLAPISSDSPEYSAAVNVITDFLESVNKKDLSRTASLLGPDNQHLQAALMRMLQEKSRRLTWVLFDSPRSLQHFNDLVSTPQWRVFESSAPTIKGERIVIGCAAPDAQIPPSQPRRLNEFLNGSTDILCIHVDFDEKSMPSIDPWYIEKQ